MNLKDVFQIIIIPIFLSLLAIKGNNILNKQTTEVFKTRKEKEMNFLEKFKEKYKYPILEKKLLLKYNNDLDSDLKNIIHCEFEGLIEDIQIYLVNNSDRNKLLKKISDYKNILLECLTHSNNLDNSNAPENDKEEKQIRLEYSSWKKTFLDTENIYTDIILLLNEMYYKS